MEPYQIALVIILVGCVGALFYLWFRNNRSVEEQPYGEGENRELDNSDSIIDPVPIKPVPTPIVSGNQKTIYAFEREVQVYVCPRCDGENSINRNICSICGYEFRKGVQ